MNNELEICIDENAYDELVPLLEDAQEVFSATNEQLNVIKEKDWIKRLFEAVTFQTGQNRYKIVYQNINTLLELQNIVLRVVLIVAKKVQIVSETLVSHSERINTLFSQLEELVNSQDIIVREVLKLKEEYHDFIFGYENELTIQELPPYKQEALLCAISIIGDYERVSAKKESQSFILETKKYLFGKYKSPEEYDFKRTLENLELKEARLFYKIILSYIFYIRGRFKFSKNTKHLLNYLSVSPSKIESLKNNVKNKVRYEGKEGLLLQLEEKKGTDENLFLITAESSWLENFDVSDCTISTEVHYSMDEWQINEPITLSNTTISNRRIKLNAFIKCSGKVTFSNCQVYFSNKSFPHSPFVMDDKTELLFEESTIRCFVEKSCESGDQKNFLIDEASNQKISFISCEIIDTSFLIKTGVNYVVSFTKCKIIDSYALMNTSISGGITNLNDCVIESNTIKEIYSSNVLSIFGGSQNNHNSLHSKNNIITISDCKVRDFISNNQAKMGDVKKRKQETYSLNFCDSSLLEVKNSYFENCYFNETTRIQRIEGCTFKNCFDPIPGTFNDDIIKSSTFENCIIKIRECNKQTNFSDNCHFINSPIDVIDASFDTCTFKNYSEKDGTPLISFSNPNRYNFRFSLCNFSDIHMNTKCIVELKEFVELNSPSPLAKFEKCTFNNCSSEIIKRKSHFHKKGLFTSKYVVYDAVTFSDCDIDGKQLT